MEIVFDYFFEEVFLKLERSDLLARHKRRDVLDQLNAVIGGCSSGMSCDGIAMLMLPRILTPNKNFTFCVS